MTHAIEDDLATRWCVSALEVSEMCPITGKAFGPAFDLHLDGPRLRRQHEQIRDLMLRAGDSKTLSEIAAITGFGEASVSAQLRHLRKRQFGAFVVEKRRRHGSGTWEYRVLPPPQSVLSLASHKTAEMATR